MTETTTVEDGGFYNILFLHLGMNKHGWKSTVKLTEREQRARSREERRTRKVTETRNATNKQTERNNATKKTRTNENDKKRPVSHVTNGDTASTTSKSKKVTGTQVRKARENGKRAERKKPERKKLTTVKERAANGTKKSKQSTKKAKKNDEEVKVYFPRSLTNVYKLDGWELRELTRSTGKVDRQYWHIPTGKICRSLWEMKIAAVKLEKEKLEEDKKK